VAVGIVAGDAVAEPEDMTYAEVVAQHALDLRAVQMGIAVGIQQARFRGQQGAAAVDFDRAAFEHDAHEVGRPAHRHRVIR